jgi:hypothetical protein
MKRHREKMVVERWGARGRHLLANEHRRLQKTTRSWKR